MLHVHDMIEHDHSFYRLMGLTPTEREGKPTLMWAAFPCDRHGVLRHDGDLVYFRVAEIKPSQKREPVAAPRPQQGRESGEDA